MVRAIRNEWGSRCCPWTSLRRRQRSGFVPQSTASRCTRPAPWRRVIARGSSGYAAMGFVPPSRRSGSPCAQTAGSSIAWRGLGPHLQAVLNSCSTLLTSCAAWARSSHRRTPTWFATTVCSPTAPGTGASCHLRRPRRPRQHPPGTRQTPSPSPPSPPGDRGPPRHPRRPPLQVAPAEPPGPHFCAASSVSTR